MDEKTEKPMSGLSPAVDDGRPVRQEISAVRQGILNKLLLIFYLVGLPAVIIGAGQAFIQGRWGFSCAYVALYLLSLTATLGSRRFAYKTRAVILVSCLYLIGLAILARIGLSGVGIIILVGVCFLAAVFFGIAGGTAAIAISLASIAVVGIGMTTGLIDIHPEHMLTSVSPFAWITFACVFLMITAVIVLAPEMFTRSIERSLGMLQRQKTEIESINDNLRKEIREREWAEQELRKSEKKYRSVIENIQDAFYRLDRERRLLMASPSAARLLGYGSTEEMLALPLEQFMPDPKERQALIDQLREHQSVTNFWAVMRKKDGSTFDASISTHYFRDDNGHILGTEGIVRDITEMKRAEKKLRESEIRYRTLFEMSADGLFLMENGLFMDCNPAALTIFGCSSRGDLLGRSPVDFSPPMQPNGEPSASAAAVRIRQALSGSPQVFEWEHLRSDRTPFSAEVVLNRIQIESRSFLLASVRDISQRKKAEEETRLLKKYLENIINSMPSILVGVDAEGRVSQWNMAAEEATGISAEKARGRIVDQVMPSLARGLEHVRAAIEGRKVKYETKVPRTARGETRYEDITIYPLITNGVEGAVIRVDDVTERTRMEEMLIQSEKMLSVGGLAAGMAHEINNPLGVILQASQNIWRRVSTDLSANIRAAEECGVSLDAVRAYLEKREIPLFLEDIRKSGERAAGIVSNMLDFSRKADDKDSRVDITELLEKTLDLAASDYDLKKKYDFKKIEIVREYEPNLPMVTCQPSNLQQVFLNILRNGAQAMQEHRAKQHAQGRMTPETPRFVLRVMKEGHMVRVEMEDNGPGMDEATRKRVFEPFFTTKPPGQGTGLGLSVSYFIVTEQHGGTLSVESTPGAGTKFIVRLPGSQETME